jgi:hypothetical protein
LPLFKKEILPVSLPKVKKKAGEQLTTQQGFDKLVAREGA